MAQKYRLDTTRREARPRSRRLRQLGAAAAGTATGGGAAVIIGGGGSGGGTAFTDPNSHWHDNKAALDQISTDTDGYEWLRQRREQTDPDTGDTYYEETREKVKAGYADMAHDLDEDSPVNDRFISRLKDDVARGNITFEQAIDVLGKAIVRQTLQVLGAASVGGGLTVGGDASIGGDATVTKDVTVGGTADITGRTYARGGVETGDYRSGTSGAKVDLDGSGELLSLVVRAFMGSPAFRSGFTGEGWRLALEDGLARLEVDELTVRQVMHVFELVIDKIRSVGGQIIVSAANGKIKTVSDAGTAWRITFEGDNQFTAHDLMRCQTFTGRDVRGYWVEVGAATADGSILVPKSEFRSWVVPEPGDEVVLMGNTADTRRQNLISISATEDGQPRIDVLDGVCQKNFTGCLRARLGNMDGITDTHFPADNQPRGNGLYADNVFLRGSFLLDTGEDVRTRFEVMEGKVQSAVESARQDSVPDRCYTANPTFSLGMSRWTTDAAPALYTAAGKWIQADGNILGSGSGTGAYIVTDGGQKVVRLTDGELIQRNADLDYTNFISFDRNGDNLFVPHQMYVAVTVRALKNSQLAVSFRNYSTGNFVEHSPLSLIRNLDKSDTYTQIVLSGMWNGRGDLCLHSHGDVLISRVVLSPDRAGTLAYRYRTLLQQSDKMVRIAAENFDDQGNVIQSSQIVTTAQANAMFSQRFNDDGTLKQTSGLVTTASFATLFSAAVKADDNIVKQASISAFVTKDQVGNLISQAEIKADQIKLEGLTTINDNFIVHDDGSIEAKNGKFTGEVNATKGSFTNVTVKGKMINSAEMLEKTSNITSAPGNTSVITLPTYDQGNVIQYLNLGICPGEEGRVVKIYNPSSMPCNVSTYSDGVAHYGYTVQSNEIIELTNVYWYNSTGKGVTSRWILTGRWEVTSSRQAIGWPY